MTATSKTSIRSVGSLSSRARKGFTLVEILIVVIILGILAAIVIPQFTNASTSARQSNMASQCQTLKSQITLYSLQHNDNAPVSTTSNGTSLFTQLTESTDATGAATTTAPFFGPYMQSVPVNPLTATTAVDYETSSQPLGTSVGTAVGWVYLATTGEFHGVNQAGLISDDGQ